MTFKTKNRCNRWGGKGHYIHNSGFVPACLNRYINIFFLYFIISINSSITKQLKNSQSIVNLKIKGFRRLWLINYNLRHINIFNNLFSEITNTGWKISFQHCWNSAETMLKLKNTYGFRIVSVLKFQVSASLGCPKFQTVSVDWNLLKLGDS